MSPVPKDATQKDRQRMFDEYKTEMIKMNPERFNADGTMKTIWHLSKLWGKNIRIIYDKKRNNTSGNGGINET